MGRCPCRLRHTFDPLGIHFDDLIDELDGFAAFSLRFADLLCISALVIDECCHVEGHCVRRWSRWDRWSCYIIDT